MAKKKKPDLFEVLKFTPVQVSLTIQGYGGEAYAGRVDRKIYEHFKRNKIDLEEFASDWDSEFEKLVPEDLRPFDPGSAYDCDNLWHASGAELTDSNEICIDDNEGNQIWASNCGVDDLEDLGVEVYESGGADLADLEDGTVVMWGGQGEKGCFFAAEFELRQPFDPKKLKVSYENCDGWWLITGVEYDGEELDGCGGYSTTGKWAEHKWIVIGEDETYEPVSLEDRESLEPVLEDEWDPTAELEKICSQLDDILDNAERTEWIPSKIKPVHVGQYECQINKIATWPWPNEAMLTWTGKHWQDSEGEKVGKPYAWRGLTEPLTFN